MVKEGGSIEGRVDRDSSSGRDREGNSGGERGRSVDIDSGGGSDRDSGSGGKRYWWCL